MVDLRGKGIEIEGDGFLRSERRVFAHKLNPGPFGEKPERLRKVHTLNLLDERECVTATAAAKTMPNLLLAGDHKGWRLFGMKRAPRLPVCARLIQFDVSLDQIDEIDPLLDVVRLGHIAGLYEYPVRPHSTQTRLRMQSKKKLPGGSIQTAALFRDDASHFALNPFRKPPEVEEDLIRTEREGTRRRKTPDDLAKLIWFDMVRVGPAAHENENGGQMPPCAMVALNTANALASQTLP